MFILTILEDLKTYIQRMDLKERLQYEIPENPDFDMVDWLSHNQRLSDKMTAVNHDAYVSFISNANPGV